jgi:hypothetical protein
MSGPERQCDQEERKAAFTPYTITVRITPGCARIEISRPREQEPGVWLAILAAVADHIASYSTIDGVQTFWAEVTLHERCA